MSERRSQTQLGALLVLVIALGAGAVAALMLGRLLSSKGYTGERTRPVVVAKRALVAAQQLSESDLEVVNFPERSIPEGAVDDPKLLWIDGKAPIPTTGILAGEPVLRGRLAKPEQGTGLAALVRPGFRAVAVKVDEAVGRSGLVYPGATVDVLATIRDPEGRGPSTKIAVDNIRVLAVESETDVATRRPRARAEGGLSATSAQSAVSGTVVTLEVSPEGAEIVSLAAREGTVDLALRNGGDNVRVETKGATPMQFSAFPGPDAALPPPPGKPGTPPKTGPRVETPRGIEIRSN